MLLQLNRCFRGLGDDSAAQCERGVLTDCCVGPALVNLTGCQILGGYDVLQDWNLDLHHGLQMYGHGRTRAFWGWTVEGVL